MIKRITFILAFIGMVVSGQGQFTYFNQIAGPVNDSVGDIFTNVEVIGDTIFTYGASADPMSGGRLHLQKYDMQGQLIDERAYNHPSWTSTPYIEVTGSFSHNIAGDRLMFSYGIHDGDVMHGIFGMLDTNMDTLWIKYYDDFYPYTYLSRNIDVGDGIVVSGKFDSDGNSSGSMIMKLDYEGNVMWSDTVNPNIGNIYTNVSILQHNEYTILGGEANILGTGNYYHQGLISKIDSDGELLWQHLENDAVLGAGRQILCKLNSGIIWSFERIKYESASSSPLDFWTLSRRYEVDVEAETVTLLNEYFADYEMRNGGVIKGLATEDGGAILLCAEYLSEYTETVPFLMKLDSLGEIEWKNNYAYEYGNNHLQRLSDIDICSDGGYVMAGSYKNWNADGAELPRSWLLKVDACGDLEWEGCEIVGVSEVVSKTGISVYPNPTSNYLNIKIDNHTDIESIEIIDITGRKILSIPFSQSINITHIKTGLYYLILKSRNGTVLLKEKVVVE